MKNIILLLVLVMAIPTIANQVFDMDKVVSMQKRADGRYNTICKNGNFEVITDLDISLNNLCPHLTSTESIEVLSMQIRDDGKFDIVCTDFSKVIASRDEILAGKACPIARVSLEEGLYRVAPGGISYYDQVIKTTYTNGVLETVKITNKVNSWKAELNCEENICTGRTSSSKNIKIEVLDKIRYSYQRGTSVDMFTKIK